MLMKDLWVSRDSSAWERGLARYWDFVKPSLRDLEVEFENLDIDSIRSMSAEGWYQFLHDKYYPWKRQRTASPPPARTLASTITLRG